MNLAIFSIIIFIFTIVLGIAFKVNCGLLGILSSFILVQFFIPDMSLKDVYMLGWPVSTFFMMFTVMLLFGIANSNGTIEVIAKKIICALRSHTNLLPICFFLVSFFLSASGAGPGIAPMLLALAMEICKKAEINFFMMAIMIECGTIGGLSPISTSGIIASELVFKIGIENYTQFWIPCIVIMSIESLTVYFIFSGHKAKCRSLNFLNGEPLIMSFPQRLTATVLLIVIVSVIIFKIDISMIAASASAFLFLTATSKDKAAISNVNWNTLILVSGMYMFITVVQHCGGLKLVADILSNIITPLTGAGIMSLISGLFATVSSSSGAVMPTFIPLCSDIYDSLNGIVSKDILVSGVIVGANCAFFSPFSVLGSITLALYPPEVPTEKLFRYHLIMTFASISFASLFCMSGILIPLLSLI